MNIRRRAANLYDRALEGGRAFTLAGLTESLVAELLDDEQDVAELLALAAGRALEAIDKERTTAKNDASLFDSLDQAVPLGEGERLSRRDMRLADWIRHLEHVSSNAARVNASAARENKRFSILAPFLTQGLDTEAAAKAWQEANPDGVLP